VDRSEPIPLSLSDGDFHVRLEDVYRREYGRLVGLVSRVSGDRGRAEELVADAMCRLSERSALFRPDGNLEAWLYRTAINLALNALKAESRRVHYERAASAEEARNRRAAGPLEEVLRAEEQRKVRSILAAMKPAEAKLLLLRHAGLSYQETAEALGLNPASVGKLVARATAKFKERYLELFG
jgi:RNA polymerase sigma-70 factor (ECF subfamily)